MHRNDDAVIGRWSSAPRLPLAETRKMAPTSNKAARHRGVGRALVFGVTSVLPKGTKFDPAEASHGVLRGDFDRLVTAGAFEKVEAAQPFPRLGERTIGYQHLALAPTNGGGLVRAFETRAEASYVPPLHFVDPVP